MIDSEGRKSKLLTMVLVFSLVVAIVDAAKRASVLLKTLAFSKLVPGNLRAIARLSRNNDLIVGIRSKEWVFVLDFCIIVLYAF